MIKLPADKTLPVRPGQIERFDFENAHRAPLLILKQDCAKFLEEIAKQAIQTCREDHLGYE
jgi:hypothetical protein